MEEIGQGSAVGSPSKLSLIANLGITNPALCHVVEGLFKNADRAAEDHRRRKNTALQFPAEIIEMLGGQETFKNLPIGFGTDPDDEDSAIAILWNRLPAPIMIGGHAHPNRSSSIFVALRYRVKDHDQWCQQYGDTIRVVRRERDPSLIQELNGQLWGVSLIARSGAADVWSLEGPQGCCPLRKAAGLQESETVNFSAEEIAAVCKAFIQNRGDDIYQVE